MPRARRILYALALLPPLVAPASPESARAEAAVARVADLVGEVTLSAGGVAPAHAVRKAEALGEGDRIETGANAWAAIAFADGSTVTIGAQSSLTIDAVAARPGGVARFFLFVGRGVFRAIVRPILTGGDAEIRTPTAVAAVRGTDLMGEIKSDSTAIAVLVGKVEVADRSTAPRSVALAPGDGTTVVAGKPPKAPSQWAAARLEALKRATSRP